jgi:hypothetical protein
MCSIETPVRIPALSNKANTGLTWQGDAVPVSHACGHDCHTAIVLAAAEALSKTKDSLKGSVMIIFQPCEESSADAKGWGMYGQTAKGCGIDGQIGRALLVAGMQSSGAMQMVFREKLFEKLPKPDAFFGLHVTGLMHGGMRLDKPADAPRDETYDAMCPFTGLIAIRPGPAMAAADMFSATITGVCISIIVLLSSIRSSLSRGGEGALMST